MVNTGVRFSVVVYSTLNVNIIHQKPTANHFLKLWPALLLDIASKKLSKNLKVPGKYLSNIFLITIMNVIKQLIEDEGIHQIYPFSHYYETTHLDNLLKQLDLTPDNLDC